MQKINFTCTTCGRLDLFIRTMDSFLDNCIDKSMINRWIIVDDGSSSNDMIEMQTRYPFLEIYENQYEQGQAGALKTLFELIDTEWFFHCEDDWEFPIKDNFITKLFQIAKTDDRFKNVTLRNWKMDIKRHETGFYYNISYYMPYTIDASITNSNWFGFSFNPGLNHLPSIKSLGNVPTDIISERYWDREYAIEYMKKGLKSANLIGGYIKHLGDDRPAYNRVIKKDKCELIALYKTFQVP